MYLKNKDAWDEHIQEKTLTSITIRIIGGGHQIMDFDDTKRGFNIYQ